MSEQWVLVADSSRARLFQRGKNWRELELICEEDYPRGRAHDGDLVTGGRGSVTESMGQGQRHSTETQVSPSEHEADRFARKLADKLRDSRVSGECADFVLVAAPALLGKLRAALDDPTRDCIRHEIDKNLAQHDITEVGKIIEATLNE